MGPEHPATHAREHPDKPAVIMGGSGATLTYRDLDETSNRVAHLLRGAGLEPGDRVALLVGNEPTWFEVAWAGLRSGLYVTPVNAHLRAEEAGFIIRDSGATVLVAAAGLASTVAALEPFLGAVRVRLAVGGPIPGFDRYEDAVAAQPATPVADEREGSWMFYSSGTTGPPKGILPGLPAGEVGAPQPFGLLLRHLYGFTADSVYLSPAPLYHAGPAGWTTQTHRLGGTTVVMEHFDPAAFLELVGRYRVTQTNVVPTHLIRLLKLDPEQREQADLSSLRQVVHAAAPCPVSVKRDALAWMGPIIHEFYSGSEGVGFCTIGPEEWLAHPGSVGRSLHGTIHILDEDGTDLGAGEEGEVWFETAHRFEYHGDPAGTAAAWNDRGMSTIGDIGRVDEEGYLYLTDRRANLIISGGVNIYPREIEDVLVVHPLVEDVAVLGRPDPDMGERVTAFVQLRAGTTPSPALAAALIETCRAQLSGFKCPRSVEFVDEVPRLPSGKLLKRLLLSDP